MDGSARRGPDWRRSATAPRATSRPGTPAPRVAAPEPSPPATAAPPVRARAGSAATRCRVGAAPAACPSSRVGARCLPGRAAGRISPAREQAASRTPRAAPRSAAGWRDSADSARWWPVSRPEPTAAASRGAGRRWPEPPRTARTPGASRRAREDPRASAACATRPWAAWKSCDSAGPRPREGWGCRHRPGLLRRQAVRVSRGCRNHRWSCPDGPWANRARERREQHLTHHRRDGGSHQWNCPVARVVNLGPQRR
ncbi:hypothetical protein CLV40_12034 [Actinokineospora auranticolor]|uniref:Uncharacterized protein n=1 Tax=Actinokineospora auranticolor TaxID=155976 RepID=A0A2S6GGI0_9PSEU|nr:hypothetical protein CLV40_12034 [Actinokineospora auranticolor]